MSEIQTMGEEDKENVNPSTAENSGVRRSRSEGFSSNDPRERSGASCLNQLSTDHSASLRTNTVSPFLTLMTPRFRKNHVSNQLITPSPVPAPRQITCSEETLSSLDKSDSRSKYFLRNVKPRDQITGEDTALVSLPEAKAHAPKKNLPPSKSTSFPDQLLAFVNSVSRFRPDVVHWSSDGHAFFIDDKLPELSHLLATHFEHGNYQSLRRQLNVYGFAKTPRTRTTRAYWFHKYFHRDERQQAFEMIVRKARDRRVTSAKRKKKSAAICTVKATKIIVHKHPLHPSASATSRSARISKQQRREQLGCPQMGRAGTDILKSVKRPRQKHEGDHQTSKTKKPKTVEELADPQPMSSAACMDRAFSDRSPAGSSTPFTFEKPILSNFETLVDVAIGESFPIPTFEFSPLVRTSEALDVRGSSMKDVGALGMKPKAIRPGVLTSPQKSSASASTDTDHDDDSCGKTADELIKEHDFLQNPWVSPMNLSSEPQGIADVEWEHPGSFIFSFNGWRNESTRLTDASGPITRRPLTFCDDNGAQARFRLYSPMDVENRAHQDDAWSCGSGRTTPKYFFAAEGTTPLTPLRLESRSLTVQSTQTQASLDALENDGIRSNTGTPYSVLSVLLPDSRQHPFESYPSSPSVASNNGTKVFSRFAQV